MDVQCDKWPRYNHVMPRELLYRLSNRQCQCLSSCLRMLNRQRALAKVVSAENRPPRPLHLPRIYMKTDSVTTELPRPSHPVGRFAHMGNGEEIDDLHARRSISYKKLLRFAAFRVESRLKEPGIIAASRSTTRQRQINKLYSLSIR